MMLPVSEPAVDPQPNHNNSHNRSHGDEQEATYHEFPFAPSVPNLLGFEE